ncbi:MAG: RNA polymerase subunit sigma-70, partial [Planctomycetaceae bacterium]|nr:RNA polymerase subunit sigma-70 [Planctomycetaceae bacterium]
MATYANPGMKKLKDQLVRHAPKKVRLEQIDRVEKLLTEIDTDQQYGYSDLCARITEHESSLYPDLKVDGKDALHDLCRLVEDLTDSVDMDVDEMEEDVLTVSDLSERFQVSTKTVDRWRQRGLVGRKVRIGARKRVVFLKSNVDRFVKANASEIRRSTRFTQLTAQERLEIVDSARRLAAQGACLSEISQKLARRMGRSTETIRYTLKHHDRDYPELAVFPHARGPLDDDARREIWHQHNRGTSVEVLAKQYCRTRSSIHRIINEVRAARIFEVSLDFIDSPEFYLPNAEATIMGPPPEVERSHQKPKIPPGLPAYLASLYDL